MNANLGARLILIFHGIVIRLSRHLERRSRSASKPVHDCYNERLFDNQTTGLQGLHVEDFRKVLASIAAPARMATLTGQRKVRQDIHQGDEYADNSCGAQRGA